MDKIADVVYVALFVYGFVRSSDQDGPYGMIAAARKKAEVFTLAATCPYCMGFWVTLFGIIVNRYVDSELLLPLSTYGGFCIMMDFRYNMEST